MKQAIISSIVLTFVLSNSALAQSTTSVVAPAAAAAKADAGPVATSSSTAEAPKAVQAINLKYTGIYEGPAFDQNAAGTTMSGDPQYISHRPALQYNVSQQANAGFQARFSTIFDANQGLIATSENHRFFANLKNVASYGILNLNLTAKGILPTSAGAHNRKMVMGAEFTPTLGISPSDSRFSFTYAPQMQKYFYSADSISRSGVNFYIMHNLEGAYQLGSTTQITAGLYPEYLSTQSATFTNSSNELDLGVNWDFAKGWSANPYIGAQLNGFELSNAGKKMEIALVVSGTIL